MNFGRPLQGRPIDRSVDYTSDSVLKLEFCAHPCPGVPGRNAGPAIRSRSHVTFPASKNWSGWPKTLSDSRNSLEVTRMPDPSRFYRFLLKWEKTKIRYISIS